MSLVRGTLKKKKFQNFAKPITYSFFSSKNSLENLFLEKNFFLKIFVILTGGTRWVHTPTKKKVKISYNQYQIRSFQVKIPQKKYFPTVKFLGPNTPYPSPKKPKPQPQGLIFNWVPVKKFEMLRVPVSYICEIVIW